MVEFQGYGIAVGYGIVVDYGTADDCQRCLFTNLY
jgi:hypothetical protein